VSLNKELHRPGDPSPWQENAVKTLEDGHA
jgi:hypothetical protein